jgi:hypothetical protein
MKSIRKVKVARPKQLTKWDPTLSYVVDYYKWLYYFRKIIYMRAKNGNKFEETTVNWLGHLNRMVHCIRPIQKEFLSIHLSYFIKKFVRVLSCPCEYVHQCSPSMKSGKWAVIHKMCTVVVLSNVALVYFRSMFLLPPCIYTGRLFMQRGRESSQTDKNV